MQKNTFNEFTRNQNIKTVEYKSVTNNKNKNKNKNKIKSAIGATVGTLVPIALMMKEKKITNPFKLEYGLKDILVLSASSVAGGVFCGMLGETKEEKKKKVKEGTFQFLNATLPPLFVAGGLKLCKEQEKSNSCPCKLLAVAAGIAAGMYTALKTTNALFSQKDETTSRQISPKDCIASADDAIGALALTKFPIVQNLHLDKMLPLIYGYCGYRAGKAD